MAGKFVLKKSSNGKYHFNLVATNGQIIATSEMYERKASALNGIESVKKNAPDAEVDDQSGEEPAVFPPPQAGVRAVARPRRSRAGPAAGDSFPGTDDGISAA